MRSEVMPIVQYPELVEHYAPYFAEVFSEEALIEFIRYISGLIISGITSTSAALGAVLLKIANVPSSYLTHAAGGDHQHPVGCFADHNPVLFGDWRCLHKRMGCYAVSRFSGWVVFDFVEGVA
jgi:hypothetical protein